MRDRGDISFEDDISVTSHVQCTQGRVGGKNIAGTRVQFSNQRILIDVPDCLLTQVLIPMKGRVAQSYKQRFMAQLEQFASATFTYEHM